MTKKPDLRDQKKAEPGVTLTNTDVDFAGDRNPKVVFSSGRLVTPDPSNVPEGQTTKG